MKLLFSCFVNTDGSGYSFKSFLNLEDISLYTIETSYGFEQYLNGTNNTLLIEQVLHQNIFVAQRV